MVASERPVTAPDNRIQESGVRIRKMRDAGSTIRQASGGRWSVGANDGCRMTDGIPEEIQGPSGLAPSVKFQVEQTERLGSEAGYTRCRKGLIYLDNPHCAARKKPVFTRIYAILRFRCHPGGERIVSAEFKSKKSPPRGRAGRKFGYDTSKKPVSSHKFAQARLSGGGREL